MNQQRLAVLGLGALGVAMLVAVVIMSVWISREKVALRKERALTTWRDMQAALPGCAADRAGRFKSSQEKRDRILSAEIQQRLKPELQRRYARLSHGELDGDWAISTAVEDINDGCDRVQIATRVRSIFGFPTEARYVRAVVDSEGEVLAVRATRE